MGYHTHFYACDRHKQTEWAKDILAKYKEQLQHEYENIPDDQFFMDNYQELKEMTDSNHYEKFHEDAEKCHWPKDVIEDTEAWFQKYRDPSFTWEVNKQNWFDRLDKIKNTGLLDLKFDGDSGIDYVALLVDNSEAFKYLRYYDYDLGLNYEIREGKIYNGDILKRYYRVKGRYCESMWFNWEGVIEMIEDYPDTDSFDETTHEYTRMRTLTDEEKAEIENLAEEYSDWYCWIV